MFFYEFLEEQVQDIALFVALFKCNILFFCNGSCFFQSVDLIEIYTGILLNSIYHGNALKWLSKIHFNAIVNDLGSSKNFLCNETVQILC